MKLSMRVLKKIDVEQFLLTGNSTLVAYQNKSLIVYDRNFTVLYAFECDEDVQSIGRDKDIIWANSVLGNSYLISAEGALKKEFLIDYLDATKREAFIDLERTGCKISLVNDKIIWRTEDRFFQFLKLDGYAIYRKNKKQLIALDEGSGDILWSFNIPEKYNWYQSSVFKSDSLEFKEAVITRIIGGSERALWILLNSGRLLGLDIATGKELHSIVYPDNVPGDWNTQRNVNIFNIHTNLDLSKKKLFGLYLQWYWEINIGSDQGEFIYYDTAITCANHGVEGMHYGSHDDENIYFFDGSNSARFGIFNRNKREITWSSEISEAKGKMPAIRKITYDERFLYVQDHDYVLHVFDEV